jgi:hypothetical protein
MPDAKAAAAAGDKVVMKDIRITLKHVIRLLNASEVTVRFIGISLHERAHSAIKDVLDDDAIAEIIKTCNVLKEKGAGG